MSWQPYDAKGRPNTPRSNPKDVGALAEPLRSRVHAMIEDCPHRGELGLVSGYRDPGTQWDLRVGRVGIKNVWNRAIHGTPVTAVPARWNEHTQQWEGGSRHQERTAADFGGTERAMQWMHANRENYGLARTVSSERWHMEANRYDVLTGRTHNKPRVPIPPYPGAPDPTLPLYPGKPITLGARGPEVQQWVMLLVGCGERGFVTQGPGNAVYGIGKVRATKRLQGRLGLTQDGIVGPRTWQAAVNEVARRKGR